MKTKIYVGLGLFIVLAGTLLITGAVSRPTNTEEAPTILGEGIDQKEAPQEEQREQEEVMIQEQEEKTLKFPGMQLDTSKMYRAVLSTTAGVITIALNAAETPATVNNFVYLAREGFYNQTVFHRIIKGFMIQGGDPKGDGTGGPGYRFDDEPFEGAYNRGIVAMANAGPNTNGSQFFIMHQDYPLPQNYVIFGEVVEGLEVVDKIAEALVKKSASGESSTPVSPVTVESVEISAE